MKIALLGKNGQVGCELQKLLASHGELLALSREEPGGDLTDVPAMIGRLEAFSPDIIFNAAAYTAVDRAETEKEASYQVNAYAVKALADYCARKHCLFVHFSTDYVFDGSGVAPRDELAPCRPINVYGKSKLLGEIAVRESGCPYLLFRTSWVYGEHGHNFLKTILRLAQTKTAIDVVNDQVGAPTAAGMIAEVSAKLALDCYKAKGRWEGVYNLIPDGEVSWYGFACWIIQEAQKRGFKMTLTPSSVRPISSREYPTAAKRPLNSRLNNGKLKAVWGGEVKDWSWYARPVLESILRDEEA